MKNWLLFVYAEMILYQEENIRKTKPDSDSTTLQCPSLFCKGHTLIRLDCTGNLHWHPALRLVVLSY